MKTAKLFIVIFLCGLSGCEVIELITPEEPPFNQQISESYHQIKLKQSSSADVVAIINLPEHELPSQSKSVIASVGQNKKGYKSWLKMVAFNEIELTAQRKYLFIVDEKPKVWFVEPKENLSFDCEMALEAELLDEPFANENARRIAILKQVKENVHEDIDQLASDNKTIDICGMLINQAIESVLVKLEQSPALAAKLSKPNGLEFGHISLEKGRAHMNVTGDIVTVEIKLGSLVKTSEEQGAEYGVFNMDR